MSKRGQLQISFGVIFSIIIIAVTLAIAGYVIVKFINVKDNTDCKIYNKNLQDKINSAWASDGSISYIFNEGSSVAGKTKQVCFGTINQTLLYQKDKAIKESLETRMRANSNLMFYPTSSCGQEAYSFTLQHVKIDGFFCVDVVSGKAPVRYAKGITDSVVKICPVNGNCTTGDSVISNVAVVSGIINGS